MARGLRPIYLECSVCGDAAAESNEDGLFYEDSVYWCISCDAPGHVSLQENDEGVLEAHWVVDDGYGD